MARDINRTDIYTNIFELKKQMYIYYQHAESKTRNFIFQSIRNIIDEMIAAYSAAYAEDDYKIKLTCINKLNNLTMSLKTEFGILSELELINKKHLFNLTESYIMPLESALSKFKNSIEDKIKKENK